MPFIVKSDMDLHQIKLQSSTGENEFAEPPIRSKTNTTRRDSKAKYKY